VRRAGKGCDMRGSRGEPLGTSDESGVNLGPGGAKNWARFVGRNWGSPLLGVGWVGWVVPPAPAARPARRASSPTKQEASV